MARIRTIKPEFTESESVGRLSREARLLFILLWTIVDDAGRTRAAPRLLASRLYAYDEDAPSLIGGWLDELAAGGQVRRYVVDGTAYLDIPKWSAHQKIDRPSESRLPAFREGSTTAHEDSRGLDAGPRTMDLGPETVDRERAPAQAREIFQETSHANRRPTRLPENWQLSPDLRSFAQDNGLDAQAVADNFADYWRAAAGQ